MKEIDLPAGISSKLNAISAVRSDSGSYSCLTWNAYGQNEMISRVLVEETPDPPSDLKVRQLGSKSVSIQFTAPYSGNSAITKYIFQWKLAKSKHQLTVFIS